MLQLEVLFNTFSPPVSHNHPSGVFPSATRTEFAVSAGIIAGPQPSLRLQVLAPATVGQVRHAGSLPRIKNYTSSPAADVLNGLDDGRVRLYVNPRRLCTTMVFHLTVASNCCTDPALTMAVKRVMDTTLS